MKTLSGKAGTAKVRTLLCLFLLFTNTYCFSQDDQADITDISRVTIVSPGLSYEKRVARLQSLYVQTYMSVNASFTINASSNDEFNLFVDPALVLQYRYYYNGDKRFRAGKRIEMNSLNYIAPIFETIYSKRRISDQHFIERNRRFVNKAGLLWGFQRNYPQRLSIDLNVGGTILFTKSRMPDGYGNIIQKNVSEFEPVFKLTFGFWLNKKPE